jgi:hypothetical protein
MSTSMPDTGTSNFTGINHLTITEAITADGDRFLDDPDLPAAITAGMENDARAGADGNVLVCLGVEPGGHDEVRVARGDDGATAVHVIVRAIELLEQVRDDLRAAGQS